MTQSPGDDLHLYSPHRSLNYVTGTRPTYTLFESTIQVVKGNGRFQKSSPHYRPPMLIKEAAASTLGPQRRCLTFVSISATSRLTLSRSVAVLTKSPKDCTKWKPFSVLLSDKLFAWSFCRISWLSRERTCEGRVCTVFRAQTGRNVEKPSV
jgi:hypothetical protein